MMTRANFLIRSLAAIVLIFAISRGIPAIADSAVAIANAPEIVIAFSHNHTNEASARQEAISRCVDSGGANCEVLITCKDSGYGSIYIYSSGIGAPLESMGSVCGFNDRVQASREARRRCEYQLAIDRTGLAVPYKDTTFEMVRSILAKNCTGLSNCQCSERFQWRDDR